MFNIEVNYLAILVAAVANMAVGFLWYSPVLFGKPWMKLMGLTAKHMAAAKKKMGMMYAISFIATIVTAYVLSVVVQTVQALSMVEGLQLAGLLWLGFVGPVQMTDVIFGGKPWKLFFINTGYQLAGLLVMGAILVLWV